MTGSGSARRRWLRDRFRSRLHRESEHNLIKYKSYRIDVCRVGKGWRASIYSPGSNSPLSNSPANLEKSEADEIVAEAKRIVDALLGPRRD